MSGSVAAGIDKLIRKYGFVQKRIAEKAGFTDQQFSDMLCGRKVIRADYLPPIALAMRISIQEIFDAGMDEDPSDCADDDDGNDQQREAG